MIRHAIAGGGRTDFAPVVAALHAYRRARLCARARADAELRLASECLGELAGFSVPQKFARIDRFRFAAHVLKLRCSSLPSPIPRGVA